MRKGLSLLAILALLFLFHPRHSYAQCTGGLINNCPTAVNPQPNDLVWGWQINQSPHTRSPTNAQVVAGALGNPLTVKLNALPSSAGSAGVNLGSGAGPTTCVPGDIWGTTGGLFYCPTAGAPQGPFGTGGGGVASALPVYTIATLPTVNTSNQGNLAFVTNCPNGSQSGGSITGCIYVVNTAGSWTPQSNPYNIATVIGGQSIYPGGATVNQGNGSKIALATGSFTAGNCRQTDASGNEVDSGGPCGASGSGSGTVTNGLVNQIPYYSVSPSGNTVAGLTVVNNAVLATNGTGVPSEVTNLPSGLTIPSPTISNPALTGTATAVNETMSGVLTVAASTTSQAGLVLTQGTAPSTPTNGQVWETASGIFGRVNGTTQGPYLYNVGTTSPLSGGGAGPNLTLACNACATTTNGGALSATAPITISAGGLIALGSQPGWITWIDNASTTVTADTYDIIESWPFANPGTINSVVYHTGGTGTPSFSLAVQVSGSPAGGCTGLTVSLSSNTTTSCGATTITNGQKLSLVLGSVSGTPTSAVIQVNISKPAS